MVRITPHFCFSHFKDRGHLEGLPQPDSFGDETDHHDGDLHLLNEMILKVRVNKELLNFDERQIPQPLVMQESLFMFVFLVIPGKLVYFTYLQDLQPTYKGVIIHLLSTMDIPEPPRLETGAARQRSLFPTPPFFGLVGCGFL